METESRDSFLSRGDLSSRQRSAAPALRPYQEGVLGWEGRKEVLHPHPESGESSPPAPHPAAEQRAPEESPAQKPASGRAGLALAAMPLASQFPPLPLARRARPGHLGARAALSALAPRLPKAQRTPHRP